jgi:hypothetical protein
LANVATGASAYTRGVAYNFVNGYQALGALGDLNGDGYLDFSFSYGDNALNNVQTSLMLSTGAGIWRAVRNTDTGPLSAPVQGVQWTDINQDGKLDMLTASSTTTQFWLATTTGNYSLAAQLPYGLATTSPRSC